MKACLERRSRYHFGAIELSFVVTGLVGVEYCGNCELIIDVDVDVDGGGGGDGDGDDSACDQKEIRLHDELSHKVTRNTIMICYSILHNMYE